MAENVSILIVDDNTSLYRTMFLILRRKGYTVATAGDGPEAIERVKETVLKNEFSSHRFSG